MSGGVKSTHGLQHVENESQLLSLFNTKCLYCAIFKAINVLGTEVQCELPKASLDHPGLAGKCMRVAYSKDRDQERLVSIATQRINHGLQRQRSTRNQQRRCVTLPPISLKHGMVVKTQSATSRGGPNTNA